jgi:hypothetical protein
MANEKIDPRWLTGEEWELYMTLHPDVGDDEITMQAYESLAECRRVMKDIKDHSVPVSRLVLEEDSLASMEFQRYERLKACIAGFPRDSKEEIEVRRQREFDKAEKEYLDPKPENDHD